jgi:hypothetical protein
MMVGEKQSVREMYAAIGRTIPLHHATRIWSRRGRELGSFDQMRYACMIHTLSMFDLTWEPPTKASYPITEDYCFTPNGITCPACGNIFCAQKSGHRNKTRSCSTVCSNKVRDHTQAWRTRRQQAEREDSGLKRYLFLNER